MQIAFKDSILLGVNLTLTIVRFFKMHSLNASLRVILSRTFFTRLLQHLSLLLSPHLFVPFVELSRNVRTISRF